MAEDSNKEQLEIQAKLDTSQLKREAKQGLNEVVKEEKKVEQQSKQTSKAIDDIGQSGKKVGNALQQAGSQGADALKQIGQEADKTTSKINEIAKATKAINIRQGIGIATQILNSDAAKTIGGAVGKGIGMDDDAMSYLGGYASSVLGGAGTGAMLGSVIPGIGTAIGAAAGALTGAATYLITSAVEMENAAEAVKRSAEETRKGNQENTEQIDKNEAEEKRVNDFVTKFQDLVNKGDFKGAERLLDKEESRATVARNAANSLLHNEYFQSDNKLYQEQVGNFNRAKTDLGRVSQLRNVLGNAQRVADVKEAQETAKKAQEAEQAKRKAEAEAKAKADEEARFEKAKDMNWKASLQEEAKQYQSQISTEESFMSKIAGTRLSDSLTKIGGGSGYGVQMQGINSYVSKMSGNIASIKTVMEKCLTTIQDIDNKYSPYGGQFISDTE